MAVIKRTQAPSDPELLKSGGFTVTTPQGQTITRNPALPHVGTLFDNILALLRSFNLIWQPEMLKKRHPDFATGYDLTEIEKQTMLGVHQPFVDNSDSTSSKNPIERMQNFFTTNFEAACHILGNIGSSFGHEFYSVPNLADSIVNSVLFGLENIPNYRLRPIIRVVLNPYIQSCPPELHKQAVIPVLKALLPYMHQHLVTEWQHHDSDKIADIEEQNPLAQEVFEDQVLRSVTREYISLLRHVTLGRRAGATGASGQNENQSDDETAQPMDEGDAPPPSLPTGKESRLSELGKFSAIVCKSKLHKRGTCERQTAQNTSPFTHLCFVNAYRCVGD